MREEPSSNGNVREIASRWRADAAISLARLRCAPPASAKSSPEFPNAPSPILVSGSAGLPRARLRHIPTVDAEAPSRSFSGPRDAGAGESRNEKVVVLWQVMNTPLPSRRRGWKPASLFGLALEENALEECRGGSEPFQSGARRRWRGPSPPGAEGPGLFRRGARRPSPPSPTRQQIKGLTAATSAGRQEPPAVRRSRHDQGVPRDRSRARAARSPPRVTSAVRC